MKNLSGEKVLSELNITYQNWRTEGNEVMDWGTVPLPELIDHIVHHHHDYLKKEYLNLVNCDENFSCSRCG